MSDSVKQKRTIYCPCFIGAFYLIFKKSVGYFKSDFEFQNLTLWQDICYFEMVYLFGCWRVAGLRIINQIYLGREKI